MNKYYFPALLGLILLLSHCKTNNPEADLLITNAGVVTMDKEFPFTEALAVKDGKILFVGSTQAALSFKGADTKVIDAEGMTAYPGLTDAHAHMLSLGNKLVQLNTNECRSYEEIVDKVAGYAGTLDKGEWIIGGRWDHSRWPNPVFPVHDLLSEKVPDNPVYLSRVDGNSAFVNAKALELAGITKDTPDPEGGKIIRKADGSPTGVLVNRAMNLVKEQFPSETDEALKEKFRQAIAHCNRYGLTGVHEAGLGPREIEVLKQLADKEELNMRVYAMLGEQEKPVLEIDDLAAYFKKNRLDNYANHMLTVRSIKLFFDGALGSRGAAFFDSYADDPGNTGLLRITPEYITRVSRAALEAGMGVCTHCIGIRGNRLCLDAYIEALMEYPDADHRFRIEHAQVVREEDIDLFAEYNIIPSMQPIHCTSDMHMIADRIGEDRTQYAYAWRSFIDAGLYVPAGSDFPVEPVHPLLGYYAAVSRQDLDGNPPGGWHMEQRMTREEALKGFTLWAARAAFLENHTGSLEKGKYADITILDRNILECRLEEIPETKVHYTIVQGEVVFSSKE